MGKLFDAVKENYDKLANFQDKQEQNYMVETTFDNIINNIKEVRYLNFFINQIENEPEYYFGSKENHQSFMEKNKELFSGNITKIPKADYDSNTVSIDVKGVDYEKILDTLEARIGEAKTKELLNNFKEYTPKEPKLLHPFEKFNKDIENGLDELNISDDKLNEYKDALKYASEELVVKATDDEQTDHIIDQINKVRELRARSSIRAVAQEVGANAEKVDSIKSTWGTVSFNINETEDKLALKPFIDAKQEYTEEYKNKVLALDKLVTEKGLISDGFVGESGTKEYGFLDYFSKADELKTALLEYGKLSDTDERINALENISLKANELKEVTNKYNDVLDFIKENFDTSKIALNANIYSGRQKDLDKGKLESFRQNLPRRWDLDKAAPGVVLSGYAQLKGAAKQAGVSIEEYLENPNKAYLLGAKKAIAAEDQKYLIPAKDEDGNQIPLGKRMAHIMVQDEKSYGNIITKYLTNSRGIEFLNSTSEYDKNTNKNVVISGAVYCLATNYDHSAYALFNKNNRPDYESLQNLFALGNDTDNLFALSKNYMQDDGTVANVDESYNLKIKVINNVSPLNETRRVMGVLRDYFAERKQMYIDRRNDNTTDVKLTEDVSPAQMMVSAKLYMNDFIYKNKIDLLALDKKQRDEVMEFINDPVKAFVLKYDGEENLLRTDDEGNLLETYDEIDKEFKSEFNRLYKKAGDNFVSAFNDLNTQTKGRNAGKSIDEILEANKGGYFERKFDSSSKEYKALVESVKAATDPQSRTYGDLSGAKVYAQKYVDHKLPQGANFDKLSENEKRRVEFCHTLIGATLQMELNQKMEESKIKLAPDNAIFQENLKKDVDLDLENNNNIIEAENEIAKENIVTQ